MVYGGKTHVLLPCCFATLSYPTSFNLFNVLLGGWAVMAAGGWAVITFGSGVVGLSVLCPHPHSTHDPMLALPVLFSSRACSWCPWCVLATACSHTHHDFGSVGSSRTGIGWFWSQADRSLVPRVVEHPRTVIHVLAVVLFIHGQNQSCFILTQGLYC